MKSPTKPYQSLDLLATLVAVVDLNSTVRFANAAFEETLGLPRRLIMGAALRELFTEPQQLQNALDGIAANTFASLRYDAVLKRAAYDLLPVHVIVAQTDAADEAIVEILPLEQQARLDREERIHDQSQANKELIRNLAHEIKNPLGGIRGSAQLLELELESDRKSVV